MNEVYKILEKYWNDNKLVISSFFDSPFEEKSLETFEAMGLHLRKNYFENEKDPVLKESKHTFFIKNSQAINKEYFEKNIIPDDLGPLLFLFQSVSNTLYVWMYLTTKKRTEEFIKENSYLLARVILKLKKHYFFL